MRALSQLIAIVLVLVIIPVLAASASAQPPHQLRTVEPEAFRPVVAQPTATPRPKPLVKADQPEPEPSSPLILDPFRNLRRQKPPIVQPEARIKEVQKAVKQKTAVIGNSRAVRGLATWYCKAGRSVCHYRYPDRRGADLYAAAGSEIRVGNWRGRTVGVCRQDGRKVRNPLNGKYVDCLPVKLVDWCACKSSRIIDLYWDAFNVMNVRGETGGVSVIVKW